MTAVQHPAIEQSIEVDVPPAVAWKLVSDVRRMPEWSPKVKSTRLRRGFDRVELGTQFTSLNCEEELEWTTHAEIVRFAPERELAFRVEENHVVWSFQLAATDGGTRITQRRETPDGVSELSQKFAGKYLGGLDAYDQRLLAGMRETLERIKAAAES